MIPIVDESAESRRFGDFDDAMRTLNITMAVIVALSAALFLHRFGVAFAVFASLPILYWSLRLTPLEPMFALRHWNVVFISMMVVSIMGAAVFSGGADSPVVFFTGILALLGHSLFPGVRVCTGIGIASILALALLDVALSRSIDPVVLLCALTIAGYLPVFADRMVTLERTQRRRAVIDQLTGCLNRHALDARIIELEEQGQRTKSSLSVVMFDLDHFKSVNDEYGHAFGDRVLEHVSYVTRKYLRRFELVYRLGGEEFAILLPGASLPVAASMAERIRQGIESSPIDGVSVTASFGVTCCEAPFGVETTIDLADRRLYVAKATGRNCVVASDAVAESAAI